MVMDLVRAGIHSVFLQTFGAKLYLKKNVPAGEHCGLLQTCQTETRVGWNKTAGDEMGPRVLRFSPLGKLIKTGPTVLALVTVILIIILIIIIIILVKDN